MFCLSDCDNAANRLSYYSDYENGSKMLVPFLQHVNVIHCNRLGSRKRFRGEHCAVNVLREFSHVTSRSKKGCHNLFSSFEELPYLEAAE